MTRTGGDKTKKKILEAAEELFSQKGFHATSVNQITRAAKVNKALVYYYFKDKGDIILSLFREIIGELSDLESRNLDIVFSDTKSLNIQEALKEEISYLEKKKKIISVMLMESLKSEDLGTSIFQCAELVMAHEHEGPKTKSGQVFEFFTGFIPLIAFVALQDKFCEYFQCKPSEALDLFIEAFTASHVDNDLNQEVPNVRRNH